MSRLMKTRRNRYQYGVLDLKQRVRGPALWVFRYYVKQPNGQSKRACMPIGDKKAIPSRSLALKKAAALRLIANPERAHVHAITIAEIIKRYITEELPNRHSTRTAYRANLRNHIE